MIEPLVLPVESIAQLLKQHHSVAVDARMLPLGHHRAEYLLHIGHIEIAAEQQVAPRPVVAAQEGVHIVYAALPRGAVAQMAHIYLTDKRRLTLNGRSRHRLHLHRIERWPKTVENLLNCSGTESTLSEHIFAPRLSVKLHHPDARGFLASVVLLLHHEIEFAQSVAICAILLLIILKRLEQPYHGHSALMFQLFHLR